MPEHDQKPITPADEARRILRRLQGEDGYEIFTDRRSEDDRERQRRENEEQYR